MNVPSEMHENEFAMLIHFSSLIGFAFPFGNIIAPLIIWQLKKSEFPNLDKHGRDAVNFQISLTIYLVVAFVLCLILVGIPLVFAIMILSVVASIRAGLAARDGRHYKYPLALDIIK